MNARLYGIVIAKTYYCVHLIVILNEYFNNVKELEGSCFHRAGHFPIGGILLSRVCNIFNKV